MPDYSIQKSCFLLFSAHEVLKGLIEQLACESVVAEQVATDAASPVRRVLFTSQGVLSHVDCLAQASTHHPVRARRNRGQPGTALEIGTALSCHGSHPPQVAFAH